MKLGEKIVFGFAVAVAVAAVAKGIRQMTAPEPKPPKNYYEWSEESLRGHTLYRSLGCNSCHRTLGVGEIGVAPVLDGEGTRRTLEWLHSYFTDPGQWVPGTAHDGSLGPDFRAMGESERKLLAAFLFALKANSGSPSYPKPPLQASVEDER